MRSGVLSCECLCEWKSESEQMQRFSSEIQESLQVIIDPNESNFH